MAQGIRSILFSLYRYPPTPAPDALSTHDARFYCVTQTCHRHTKHRVNFSASIVFSFQTRIEIMAELAPLRQDTESPPLSPDFKKSDQKNLNTIVNKRTVFAAAIVILVLLLVVVVLAALLGVERAKHRGWCNLSFVPAVTRIPFELSSA